MIKKCSRCGIEKDEIQFPKDKSRKDGIYPQCKICKGLDAKKYDKKNRENRREYLKVWRSKNPHKNNEYAKTYREKNRDKIIAKNHTSEMRERFLTYTKVWRSKNKDRYLEQQREWKKNNRFKINARFRVTNSIRRGKIKRGITCNQCGTSQGKMEAHHEDYNKPLEVIWLCFKCHKQKHGKLKNG